MNKQRLRDMSLGFLLCLALVGSYYCGASGNPTNANASSPDILEEVRTKKLVIINGHGREVVIAGSDSLEAYDPLKRSGAGFIKVIGQQGDDRRCMRCSY